ncbi:MAG: pilus assembly protein TadG-related protein [Peptococcia bacterium]
MMNTLLRKLKIVVPGIRKKVGNEQGSVLVLFAMSLTVLLGFTALVIDVGTAYLQNVRLSNAVDAAALAGSQALPDSPARAYQLALDYAEKNGVAPEDLTIEITDDNREINVEARKHVAYSFAPVLGISSVDVQQGAGAKVGSVSSVWGAVPFSIQKQELCLWRRCMS